MFKMQETITASEDNQIRMPSVPVNPVIKLNIVNTNSLINSPSEEYSSESDSDDEVEEGYYVEFSLLCSDDDGNEEHQTLMLNFGTESNYLDCAEAGFDGLDDYFIDGISLNFPEWDYADDWEELDVYGDQLPDHHDPDAVIVDIV